MNAIARVPCSVFRGFWLLMAALMMVSCVSGPSITRTPKGGYHANAGYTLLGEQEGVVAEITTAEGDHIKFVAKKQNGARVAVKWLDWWGTKGVGEILAGTEQAKI